MYALILYYKQLHKFVMRYATETWRILSSGITKQLFVLALQNLYFLIHLKGVVFIFYIAVRYLDKSSWRLFTDHIIIIWKKSLIENLIINTIKNNPTSKGPSNEFTSMLIRFIIPLRVSHSREIISNVYNINNNTNAECINVHFHVYNIFGFPNDDHIMRTHREPKWLTSCTGIAKAFTI